MSSSSRATVSPFQQVNEDAHNQRSQTQLRIAFNINQGKERDYQEDDFTICPDLNSGQWGRLPEGIYPHGHLGAMLVVADGMGGMEAGEVASRKAIEGFANYFLPPQNLPVTSNLNIKSLLFKAIESANHYIRDHATRHLETEGMGTTLVAAWVINGRLCVAWSGDSRCYLLRPGQPIEQVNHDHSYVQELVDNKEISKEDAFYHPNKNIITQSLGDSERPPKPGFEEYKGGSLRSGDRILLCSDGLNSMLHDHEIQELLGQGDVTSAAYALVGAANQAGGHDNITVVIAEVVEVGNMPAVAPAGMQKSSDAITQRNKALLMITIPIFLLIIGFILFQYLNTPPDIGDPAKSVVPLDREDYINEKVKDVPKDQDIKPQQPEDKNAKIKKQASSFGVKKEIKPDPNKEQKPVDPEIEKLKQLLKIALSEDSNLKEIHDYVNTADANFEVAKAMICGERYKYTTSKGLEEYQDKINCISRIELPPGSSDSSQKKKTIDIPQFGVLIATLETPNGALIQSREEARHLNRPIEIVNEYYRKNKKNRVHYLVVAGSFLTAESANNYLSEILKERIKYKEKNKDRSKPRYEKSKVIKYKKQDRTLVRII